MRETKGQKETGCKVVSLYKKTEQPTEPIYIDFFARAKIISKLDSLVQSCRKSDFVSSDSKEMIETFYKSVSDPKLLEVFETKYLERLVGKLFCKNLSQFVLASKLFAPELRLNNENILHLDS